MNQSVSTNDAPAALGPYSQAVTFGNTVYCSGQVGLNPQTKEFAHGVENQARQVLKNLKAVLKAADCTPNDVVKVTIFMTNVDDFKLVNEIYAEFFADNECLPARSAVGVASLPAGALIEMEAIAQK
ncbi:Rid family detoxifying hydrolase [Lactobacillaceae bacterium Scapto_B20]